MRPGGLWFYGRLLARGVDPNSVDPNGEPMLVVASRAGFEPTVDALLRAGAKVDAQNGFGDTAIMVASLGGHLVLVKKLHARGAEINPAGWTPLSYAATNGNTEVARYLLDIGANPNALSPNGTTALMMAVRGGHADTVELLLANGADVNVRNQSGASALTWATRGGFDAIEKALLKRGAPNAAPSRKQ
jgi:ankyrin repeat protein